MASTTPSTDAIYFGMTVLFSALIGCWCGKGPFKVGRGRVPVLPHLAMLVCVGAAVFGGVAGHLFMLGVENPTSLQIASLFCAFAVSLPVAGVLHLFLRLLVGPPADGDVVNLSVAPRARRLPGASAPG